MSRSPATPLISLIMALFLVLAGAIAAPQKAVAASTVTNARAAGDAFSTRFVIDLTQTVAFVATTETNPDRISIELDRVNFDLPPGVGRKMRGLVKNFSYGSVNEGKSQILIDTIGPVRIANSFVLEAQQEQPARLVLDLVKTGFDAATTMQPPAPYAGEQKVVVIDAGHGGIDPGAVSAKGTKEKDVVLAFAVNLQKRLAASSRYKVVMTRDTDRFIKLKDRVQIARDAAADLFIAVHADIIRGKSARGTTLYTLSEKASDAEAEALAHKENRTDIIAGFDFENENAKVTDVLIELVQRESKNLSIVFSRTAAKAISKVAQMNGKPIRSAGFVVLKAPDVPSVLIELGYLSSKQDEKLLLSNDWQDSAAGALADAIGTYFDQVGPATSAAATP